MIEGIHISNLGVIEEADLDLPAGMTALTGETGAGKTMAVTSFQLLLGAKADTTKVRRGAEEARVEGRFLVSEDNPVVARVRDAGADVDIEDGVAAIIAARVVPARGRSRAFLGGRSVPTATLRDVVSELVTIHGQSDQIRLAGAARQRDALDAFSPESPAALARWREAYEAWGRASAQLQDFEASMARAAERRLAAEALLSRIDAVNPEPDEEERLKLESHRLESAEDRYAAFSAAAADLSGSDSVDTPAASMLGAALDKLRALDDDEVAPLVERLESASAEVDDIAAALADLAAASEAQPDRLEEIFSRRQELAGLRKELGLGIPEALEAAERARRELEDLGDPDATRERLEAELATTETAMRAAGGDLHALRERSAAELGERVSAELPDLSLPDARFRIVLTAAEPGPSGMDSVEFQLASHAAAPLTAIGKGASGGELSRVMLALEVSLAEGANATDHTFIFDEVDSGVGGSAALAVGARLARLAKTAQTIVVTHLAQVAAHAGTQALVVKNTDASGARTEVKPVEGEARLAELARMLAGNDTEVARAHAAELLRNASVAR